jgi:hypothetical protein
MTMTPPDFTHSVETPAQLGPNPDVQAALFLAQHLRQLPDGHEAEFGLRRAVALLASQALVHDERESTHRNVHRLHVWLGRRSEAMDNYDAG